MARQNASQEIEWHLSQAQLILLLISPDFIYAENDYIEHALERQRSNEAIVIPMLLRPIDVWTTTELGAIQAIPRHGRAITEFSSQSVAMQEVTQEIKKVVESLKSARSK